jgi:uncharacterized protein
MKQWFIPKVYAKTVFDINYESLLSEGINRLCFDLDNTLLERSKSIPSWKTKSLIQNLKEKGFTVLLLSNNASGIRVTRVAEFLEVDGLFRCFKPFPWIYHKLEDAGFLVENTAVIGDQLLMDILGGNIHGYSTIYVDQLGPELTLFRKLYIRSEKLLLKFIRRFFEK